MQDFTGVPCVVDMVVMRDAITDLGRNPMRINPLIPTELVIDHSVIADVYASPDAFRINARLEFERSAERYQLLRWAQTALTDFSVVPPDTDICQQVNLEFCPGSCSPGRASEGPRRTRPCWWAPTRGDAPAAACGCDGRHDRPFRPVQIKIDGAPAHVDNGAS
ncbi:MAG: aconitase family protein [Pseudonocardia sp.]